MLSLELSRIDQDKKIFFFISFLFFDNLIYMHMYIYIFTCFFFFFFFKKELG